MKKLREIFTIKSRGFLIGFVGLFGSLFLVGFSAEETIPGWCAGIAGLLAFACYAYAWIQNR